MILCVAGNPAIDKLFEIERVDVGEIHRPLEFVKRPGGKGLNVACAAAQLGSEVTVSGLLGGHAGRWIEDQLASEPVEGSFVWTSVETRSSLSVADRQTKSLTEFYEESPRIDAGDWDRLVSNVLGLIGRAQWMTVSGTLPPGAPVDGYCPIIRAAHAAGVPVALDTRGQTLAHSLREQPTVVKVNGSEAAELLDAAVDEPASALSACVRIRELIGGDGHAVGVTLGTDGAVIVDPAGEGYFLTLDIVGAYPVGSGDAFLAGLASGLAQGSLWSDAGRLAVGTAAANAEVAGAGVFDRERALELAKRTVVKPLGDCSGPERTSLAA
jgi:tagatose 6-phosphate kinase